MNEIERRREPEEEESLMNDLLWADPLKTSLALVLSEVKNKARNISV
jgi:hypothetical protein